MVEEKARSLLPRHNFASLSYYIVEYVGRGMTIDAFVSVLLEMLDTPEKVRIIFNLFNECLVRAIHIPLVLLHAAYTCY